MGDLEDFMSVGFDEMVSRTGAIKLTFKDQEYECVPGDDEVGNTLMTGGYLEDRKFEVHVRKSAFTESDPAPKASDTITIAEQDYRVDEAVTSPGDPCICLRCISMQR